MNPDNPGIVFHSSIFTIFWHQKKIIVGDSCFHQ